MNFKALLTLGCLLLASLFVMVSKSYAQGVQSCSAVFTLMEPQKALRIYTSTSSFYKINSKLRDTGFSSLTPEEALLANSLKADLESLPEYRGIAYRGIRVNSTPEEIINLYPIGKMIDFTGFTSTSKNRDIARNFGSLLGHPGYKTVLFEFESSKGRSIEAFVKDYLKVEQEVLFAPSKFEVTSVSQVSPSEFVITLRDPLQK